MHLRTGPPPGQDGAVEQSRAGETGRLAPVRNTCPAADERGKGLVPGLDFVDCLEPNDAEVATHLSLEHLSDKCAGNIASGEALEEWAKCAITIAVGPFRVGDFHRPAMFVLPCVREGRGKPGKRDPCVIACPLSGAAAMVGDIWRRHTTPITDDATRL